MVCGPSHRWGIHLGTCVHMDFYCYSECVGEIWERWVLQSKTAWSVSMPAQGIMCCLGQDSN